MSDEDINEEKELTMLDAVLGTEEGNDELDADELEEFSLDGVETLADAKRLLAENTEKIHKRNVSLRKSKKARDRMGDELKGALSQLQAVQDEITQIKANGSKSHEEPTGISQEKWAEMITDDPTASIQYMDQAVSGLEIRLANSLKSFEDNFTGILQQRDPDMLEFADKIEALKGTGQFEGMSPKALLQVAKALSSKKVNQPRGSAGGGKIAATVKKGEVSDEDREMLRTAMGIGE